MKKVFITYADERFKDSRERILCEAVSTGFFTEVRGFGPEQLTLSTQQSSLMQVSRGGGLWVWKPDIILQTLDHLKDGDLLIYADSGCTLRQSSEWKYYFNQLNKYDILAHRIHKINAQWSRSEVIEAFSDNPNGWESKYQCCATVVMIRCSELSRRIVREWKETMLQHPEMVYDVESNDRENQHVGFVENRHDQSIWSALVYKYLHTGRIKIIWERIEGHRYFYSQAIEATRLGNGIKLHYDLSYHMKNFPKQLVKSIVYRRYIF